MYDLDGTMTVTGKIALHTLNLQLTSDPGTVENWDDDLNLIQTLLGQGKRRIHNTTTTADDAGQTRVPTTSVGSRDRVENLHLSLTACSGRKLYRTCGHSPKIGCLHQVQVVTPRPRRIHYKPKTL